MADLVAGPCLEGSDELALVDQAILQRQQAEEHVMVGGVHGTDLPGGQPERWAFVPHVGGLRQGCEPDRSDYRMPDYQRSPTTGR